VGGGPFTALSMLTEGHCQVVIIPPVYVGDPLLKSSSKLSILTEIFHCLPQSLQANNILICITKMLGNEEAPF